MDARLKPFIRLPISPDKFWMSVMLSTSDLASSLPEELAESVPKGPLCFVLWYSVDTKEYHIFSGACDPFELLMQSVTEFAEMRGEDAYRPDCLVVTSTEEMANRLFDELDSFGTTVVFEDDLPIIGKLQEALRDKIADQIMWNTKLPSLAKTGCSDALLREYAEAAAAFYRSRLWEHLDQYDLLRVETPKSPRKLNYVTLFGRGRPHYGLGMHPNEKSHWDLLNQQATETNGDLATLMFHGPDAVTAEDRALWSKLDLPLETADAFPIAVILDNCLPVTPDPKDIRFLTTLLGALAQTTETDIDSGKWEKSVTVEGKSKQCVISIPDLLAPPTRQQWLARGVMCDDRSGERLNKLIQGEIDAQPEFDLDAINKLIETKFVGKSLDDFDFPANTPDERAENLFYQALDNHGRRRIQLLREAIAEAPDHLDSQVLLAESLLDPEQLVEVLKSASERWRSKNKAMFLKHTKHFWEVTEGRPFIRALEVIANAYEQLGQRNEAISQMQEILSLDEKDHLGVRHRLVPLLICANRLDEATRVLNQYPEETASWLYLNALTTFGSKETMSGFEQIAIAAALKANSKVIEFLDPKTPPYRPTTYTPGSREEAANIVYEQRECWNEVEGFIPFVVKSTAIYIAAINDPGGLKKLHREQQKKLRELQGKDTKKKKRK